MDSTFREYNPATTTAREVPRTIAEGEMKREDIEQWTREAGGFDATPEFLAKFAALVASAERKACADMVDSYVGFVSELSDSILARGEE